MCTVVDLSLIIYIQCQHGGNPRSDSKNKPSHGRVIVVECGPEYSVLSILILSNHPEPVKHFPWYWETPSECYEEADEAAELDHILSTTSTTSVRSELSAEVGTDWDCLCSHYSLTVTHI